MNDKTELIVQAAQAQFMRYGFAKTTMSDIAAEAGVARQTVYNAFPGKEDILRVVVRQFGEQNLITIKTAWQDDHGIAAKLETYHRLGPVNWFETIRAAPDWAALMEGLHSAAAEELGTLDNAWRSAIKTMVINELPEAPSDIDQIIEFIHSASTNAKYGADDVTHLKSRLNTIKLAALALLGV